MSSPTGSSAYYLRFCEAAPGQTFWQSDPVKMPDPITIPGECVVKGHENEILLSVWSFGGTQPTAADIGGAQSIGRASFSDFSISLPGQSASPRLLQHMCKGRVIKAGIVVAERTATFQGESADKGALPYIMWCFYDMMVASYSDSGVAMGGLPTQHISLRFGSARTLYRKFDRQGKPVGWLPFFWDVRANRAS